MIQAMKRMAQKISEMNASKIEGMREEIEAAVAPFVHGSFFRLRDKPFVGSVIADSDSAKKLREDGLIFGTLYSKDGKSFEYAAIATRLEQIDEAAFNLFRAQSSGS
jgi:hypothetical protein